MERKKIIRHYLTVFTLFSITLNTIAQVGIGTDKPNSSAALDISFNNKGLLIPRVSLTGTSDNGTIPQPATSLLVYNTNASMGGGGGTGYYFNSGTPAAPDWTRIATGAISGNPWLLTGNGGTNPGSNFIGTSDNTALVFRTNNIQSGRLDGLLRNYFFGQEAGLNNTGTGNVALGHTALRNNAARSGLVAIGDSVLFNNAVGASSAAHGTNNTGVGSRALRQNSTGFANTALGARALLSNTDGNNNTAAGADALRDNTTGERNSALGRGALQSNISGSGNSAGGYFALNKNTSGGSNTAFGNQALENNTTATGNTALGANALQNNTIGSANTAAGVKAAGSNTTGERITAIGFEALEGTTVGQGNDLVAVGYRALRVRGAGANNTAVGVEALENTTGGGNTAIGYRAGRGITTGTNNTAIGNNTTISSTLNNATAIGNGAAVTSSNTIRVGNASVTSIGGAVAWSPPSDVRIKSQIQENAPGLDFVLGLRPVSYLVDRKKMAQLMMGSLYDPEAVKDFQEDKERHIGLIAQEVDALIKQKGVPFDVVDRSGENNEVFGLRYSLFVVPLINAVKEQQDQIDSLMQKVELLKNKLEQKASSQKP